MPLINPEVEEEIKEGNNTSFQNKPGEKKNSIVILDQAKKDFNQFPLINAETLLINDKKSIKFKNPLKMEASIIKTEKKRKHIRSKTTIRPSIGPENSYCCSNLF